MSQDIPKTVSIGGMVYTVKAREMDGKYGHCDTAKLELWLDDTTHKTRQIKTLVHEIVHAWLYEMGQARWQDEKIVDDLEHHLFTLLKDNDFSWVRAISDEERSE